MLPQAAEFRASRKLRDPSEEQVRGWMQEYEGTYRNIDSLLEHAVQIEVADEARAVALDGKSVALLTQVSILSALLAGVEFAAWQALAWWQRGCLVAADFYLVLALWSLLATGRPGKQHVFWLDDLTEVSRSSGSDGLPDLRIAAARLAFVRANNPIRIRLSNRLETTFILVRNALLLAAFAIGSRGLIQI